MISKYQLLEAVSVLSTCYYDKIYIQTKRCFYVFCCCIRQKLTVEEIGGHQELECYLWSDRKFWDLRGTVCVAHLVREVHAHLLQNM